MGSVWLDAEGWDDAVLLEAEPVLAEDLGGLHADSAEAEAPAVAEVVTGVVAGVVGAGDLDRRADDRDLQVDEGDREVADFLLAFDGDVDGGG